MPPLLLHILHTKIVTFVIFPATTEQHGERNFVRTVISSRRYAIFRQRLVVRLKPAARVAKDGLPVGTGNLAAEVRTQASPRAGFKVELLQHIVHADVAQPRHVRYLARDAPPRTLEEKAKVHCNKFQILENMSP